MLGEIRVVANTLGLPVRVIRRDLVPRCGPIGGVHTAQKTSRFEAELFLACDMPFVSAEWLAALLAAFHRQPRALFTAVNRVAGFPVAAAGGFAGRRGADLRRKYSLQELARALRARLIRRRAPAGPNSSTSIARRLADRAADLGRAAKAPGGAEANPRKSGL